jgi:hypothetical protein
MKLANDEEIERLLQALLEYTADLPPTAIIHYRKLMAGIAQIIESDADLCNLPDLHIPVGEFRQDIRDALAELASETN